MTEPGPVIVIFGITGDLSKRYLLPTLYSLFSRDLLPPNTAIIGTSRQSLATDALLDTIKQCVTEANGQCDPQVLEKIQGALRARKLNPDDSNDFIDLKRDLDKLDKDVKRVRLFYMSIPAEAYGPIVEQLGKAGLNDNSRSRLMLEKPFGNSLTSAQALINIVDKVFEEKQVYRIDHYLAKEGTLEIMNFRFSNPNFASIWNSKHISKVTVRALEAIGIENRADFYEQTGALRDFAQNHLMQLLATALMSVPQSIDSASIHQAKQDFLSSVMPADPSKAVRGQYQGYRQEVSQPDSTTETYVRFELASSSEKWQGAKLVLETGKQLSERLAEIVVDFKTSKGSANQVVFYIQPKEKIEFVSKVAEPAFDQAVNTADTSSSYKNRGNSWHMDAYERVLLDAIQGDQSLFASSTEILESWRIIQPLLDAWRTESGGPSIYRPGSAGPKD